MKLHLISYKRARIAIPAKPTRPAAATFWALDSPAGAEVLVAPSLPLVDVAPSPSVLDEVEVLSELSVLVEEP